MPRRHEITELSRILEHRLGELGLSIGDVCDRTDVGYEQVRKIFRGHATPSKSLLRQLSAALQLPFDSLWEVLVADQIRQKYGNVPARIVEKNPEMQDFEKLWPQLKPDQKKHLQLIAEAFVRENILNARKSPLRSIATTARASRSLPSLPEE